jgi:hypothetical protein
MKHFCTIVVCLAGGLVLNASRGADNPYAPIATRNIFGLNPPQPREAAPPPEPPSKITLDGIMTILGSAQALFYVNVPPHPPVPATQKSYILSEGQGQDDIVVTHIDLKKNVVTFNNHGVVQEIPLVKAGPITTPTPVVMNPSAPAMNAGLAARGAAPRGPGGGNLVRFGNNPGQNRNMGNNAGNPGGPGFGSTGASTSRPAQQRLSPEEQMIMIAAQHAEAQKEGNPISPLFPPTPLDEAAGVVPNNGSSSTLPTP